MLVLDSTNKFDVEIPEKLESDQVVRLIAFCENLDLNTRATRQGKFYNFKIEGLDVSNCSKYYNIVSQAARQIILKSS